MARPKVKHKKAPAGAVPRRDKESEAEAQLHTGMPQTRHKSVEVARRYMRSADLWRNNVTEKVMRPRP